MHRNLMIQYETAELKRQWSLIAASRINALKRIHSKSYRDATGLEITDPPELWRYAFAKSEPRIDPLSPEELTRTKELGKHIRQHDPAFYADQTYETWRQGLSQLGVPTLCETTQHLAARAKDDAELARWLPKLLKLYERPPISRAEYDQARPDSDQTVWLLVNNWIQDPPGENWATASFCFFSDLAMAKMVYFLRKRKCMPLLDENNKSAEEREIERIKKIYHRLELLPAKPRLIKDVQFKSAEVHFVPYVKARSRGIPHRNIR